MKKLLTALMLFLPILAWGQASFDDENSLYEASPTDPDTWAGAITVSAGSVLLLTVATRGNDTIDGVTDNASGGSNTWTQVTGSPITISPRHFIQYYTTASGSETLDITMNFSDTPVEYWAFVIEMSGVSEDELDAASNDTNSGSGTAWDAVDDTGTNPVTTTTTEDAGICTAMYFFGGGFWNEPSTYESGYTWMTENATGEVRGMYQTFTGGELTTDADITTPQTESGKQVFLTCFGDTASAGPSIQVLRRRR